MSDVPNWAPVVPLGEWVRHNADYLYKTNRVVLRENLQNAIDAIRMSRRARRGSPRVDVTYDPARKSLVIHDNGIGMSLEEQHKSFWSPYGSRKRELPQSERLRQGVIGQFGIGAYASLRVARRVTVISKPEGSPNSPPSGTSAALEKPLQEYKRDESPVIEFRDLTAHEAANDWQWGSNPGTSVILDLVDPLCITEACGWLAEACAFLSESVTFQGRRINTHVREFRSLTLTESNEVDVDLSPYRNPGGIRRVKVRVGLDRDQDPNVELCSVTFADSEEEISCRGVLRLSPAMNHCGTVILKHRFQFVNLLNTDTWVESNVPQESRYTIKSLKFDGELDLPFVDPDPSREGFSQQGTLQTCAILMSLSRAVLDEAARSGEEVLQRCDRLFDFIWSEPIAQRHKILSKYAFRVVGKEQRETLDYLATCKSQDQDLRFLYLTSEADGSARDLVRSLSLLDNNRIIELEGPKYWRGYSLEKIVEEFLGADNIAGARHFVSVLKDDQIGAWQGYRGKFADALRQVIGPGWQLQIASIEPAEIALVVREGTGIVYANYSNANVRTLPELGLVGPNLESVIRSWRYGRVAAEEMEKQLVKQGKLVVIQKIIRLVRVKPSHDAYVPEPDDQLLLVERDNSASYCLRVSFLCQPNLAEVVDNSGNLRPGYSVHLTWTASTFNFLFHNENASQPAMLFEFKTGVVLRNPYRGDGDNNLSGEEDYNFRVENFKGPDFSDTVSYFVLPEWIGNLLDLQRSKMGATQISVTPQMISKSLDGSVEPKWWTRLWARWSARE